MPMKVMVIRRWEVGFAFGVVVLAFVFAAVILTHQQSDLRSQQIAIQQSRVASCKHTYEGVREIFRPLLPPLRQRTPKMRRDIAKFNRTIDSLKARCVAQTKPINHGAGNHK